MERKLILYIAMSIDGYIAGPEDNLDFLSLVEEEGQDYGYQAFINSVDTILIGRKTYDKVRSMGVEYHSDKKVYVLTRTPKPDIGSATFYTGDLAALVSGLKAAPGKHIYCDGGAELADQLLRLGLIDEYILSVIPVFLGRGTALFKEGIPEQKLRLISAQAFGKGLVQMRYGAQR